MADKNETSIVSSDSESSDSCIIYFNLIRDWRSRVLEEKAIFTINSCEAVFMQIKLKNCTNTLS